MCVVALAWKAHPQWQLVVAGNRDEFHARPSAPLDRWTEAPHILAGRDLLSGGGWMGVSEQGRFAVITNVRNPDGPDPDKLTRGRLVGDALAGDGAYRDPAVAMLDGFNPFNLITISDGQAALLSNRPQPVRMDLAAGIHSLSNGAIGGDWPRKDRLAADLAAWLEGGEEPAALFASLAVRGERPPDPYGDPADIPVFIASPDYGTRCSTVIAIDAKGQGLITERRFASDGSAAGETTFGFTWP